ncbi:NAD-dependent epimerase/dehydratase family protein [Helicobacter himalayensis]|uniref:NAD-dependent epimerase/dehydratase family protein n=1 Tax=Helicobacter himalayensis TaxID=1591088 RepID=UPI003D6EF8C7
MTICVQKQATNFYLNQRGGGGHYLKGTKPTYPNLKSKVIFACLRIIAKGSSMNILITGGAGFIGTALAQKLSGLSHKVALLDFEQKFQTIHKNFKCFGVDIRESKNFTSLDSEKFECIFHCAAQTSGAISQEYPELDVDTNVKGTLNVCNFARKCGAHKIIFTSSMATYGNKSGAITESSFKDPLSNYGVSKLSGERYIKMFAHFEITYTIFRLFNVYGPGQDMKNLKQGMASIFMAQSLLGDCIKVTGSLQRYRDFVYIDDAVDALILGLDARSDFQTYNVGSNTATSVQELLALIANLQPHKHFDIQNIGTHEGDQFGCVADITKIQELGWIPKISLNVGLERMFIYAKQALGV